MSVPANDPSLIAAIQAIKDMPSQQDQTLLQQQMARAQALRQPMPSGQTQMAGRVAIHNSPLALIGPAISDYVSNKKQSDVLGQQQAMAQQMRDHTGKYIDALTAQYNQATNPNANHPDTQAALSTAQPDQTGAADLGGYAP